jgi:uncharacterized membrane-anchored protein
MTPQTSRPLAPWRFHPQRDGLMAEAHARPSTPAVAPQLAARIATLSGEGEADDDRAHVAKLCRKLGVAEPGPQARWCVIDAGAWKLRWERHTEVSTWTVFRPHPDGDKTNFAETALDLAPQDWLAGLPGEVLAAAHVALVRKAPATMIFAEEDTIASDVAMGAIQAYTDFRAGPDGFTRFIVVQSEPAAVLAGRVLQQLFEIETYRMLALLAFPEATACANYLSKLERDAADAAFQVAEEGGVEADRDLLARLSALAGEAESLAGGCAFRFSASRAYHGLVRERIRQLNERPLGNRPTIGDFMERRLAPAMRTVEATAERQREVIARIARTAQMLSTRVDVAAEATTAGLLASMDRRAQVQLRVQETVEGLSAAAISYYALGLLHFVIEAAGQLAPGLNPTLATGLAAPFVVYAVWVFLRRMRLQILKHHSSTEGTPPPPAPRSPRP